MNRDDRKRLEIRVWGRAVGVLEKSASQKHVFTYLPDAPETHFVSLTMPVRVESYAWEGGLHPIFQMNLPEGFRKDRLREKFGPVATVDDFSLLALTGSSTLGRLTAHAREGEVQPMPARHRPVSDILARPDSRGALLEYLAETVLDGISGVMPKLLSEDERLTISTPEWILKTSREDTPGVCVNEFICLRLAQKIGLPVPTVKLSEDGEVLAVMRFDIGKDGQLLGLEDMCSLLGMPPSEKYGATAEQIARAMMAFVSSAEMLDSSKRLLDMLLLNAAVRNADAHAKNYALLYSNRNDAALAPVYDIVTVHAYASYARNPYALLVGGSKGWNLRKPLEKFASERLSLDSSRIGQSVDRIAAHMASLDGEITAMGKAFPAFRETSGKMRRAWSEGIAGLSGKSKPNQLTGLTRR